jgi:nicotinamidase-related amidase
MILQRDENKSESIPNTDLPTPASPVLKLYQFHANRFPNAPSMAGILVLEMIVATSLRAAVTSFGSTPLRRRRESLMSVSRQLLLLAFALLLMCPTFAEEPVTLELRSQASVPGGSFRTQSESQPWLPSKTAIIVCDVWDYHHCLNAVRRVGEFAPRLDEVLRSARQRGVTIIHSPSDCMEAYRDHPARQRAVLTPIAGELPDKIGSWCSIIPAEEQAVYPIDQSDGGEDDDPEEHQQWAAKLEAMGRNPKAPWKRQSDLITIDGERDYISDRGEEVWSILSERGIDNVILVGVHTNMCVLGRPFGLRQMAQNGKNVVLMRDMTDTMYNPARWPYVSHFEGTRRIIDHIERYVCPTITSDQWIGGEPFRFAGDDGKRDTTKVEPKESDWATVEVPHAHADAAHHNTPHWYRCVVRVPKAWLDDKIEFKCHSEAARVWINGKELPGNLKESGVNRFLVPQEWVEADDANLFVVQIPNGVLDPAPILRVGDDKLTLAGRWQWKIGEDQANSNMPLPSKFGASTDIVFTPDP